MIRDVGSAWTSLRIKNKATAKERTKRPDENTQPSRRGHGRDGGLEKGDKQFLNVAGGVRPVLSQYDEPDTVLMVELNWERAGHDEVDGADVADTGGWEPFVSPVLWWTYGQIAYHF